MDIQIDKIDNKTWIFNEEGVRFFLLIGENKALLIDSGMTTKNAKEIAQKFTNLPINLLNTHADPDHISSNYEFESFYMSPAEATNYYKSQNGKGTLIPVWDDTIIDLGNRPLKIIEMPGHTPGSIVVLDINNKILFSGVPIQTGNIFMFGPQREIHAYRENLKRINNFSSEFSNIYPSHGDYPVKSDLINELIDASTKILNNEIEYSEKEIFGNTIRDYDVNCAHFYCDNIMDNKNE